MSICFAKLTQSNIRQRGIGNTNPVKFGRCIKELERIYGVREGSGGKVSKDLDAQNELPKTEDELSDILGISVSTLKRYKQLASTIPELEEVITGGKCRKILLRKMK